MITKQNDNIIQKNNNELTECSFDKWYKNFEKISIPSKFIEIPSNIVNYFRDDIIILPKECYPNSGEINDTNDDNNIDNDDDNDNAYKTPEFPDFSNQIRQTISELSGEVFIKSNWHSPKDAFWITAGQTLKVKDIEDVYQLLKASSIIKMDLNNHDILCDDNRKYFLVIKEWQEIHPGTEFRCFVKNRKLIAISPRDWPQYHCYILSERTDIISDILSMFKEKIKCQFPLENFVFDIVRDKKDNVYLLDFSPFNSEFTDSLAFDWQYLEDLCLDTIGNEDNPEFRYLATDCGIQPNRRNNYGVPQDIIDMFSSSEYTNLADLLANQVQDALNIQTQESRV